MARGDEQHRNPKSDIDIAQAATMQPIGQVAADKLGIPDEALSPYGRYKAKISLDYIRTLADRPNGRLILFSSTRGGKKQLWTIAPDGSNARQITNEPRGASDPAWGPLSAR